MTAEWEVPGPPGTRFLSIRHVLRTGSTNADLLARAGGGGPEGLVLVADHQESGRGRQARRWHDEAGNSMLLSVLLRPPAPWAALVPLLVGLAVTDAVDTVVGHPAGESSVALKWPNDVLAPGHGERKLAGILAEATTEGGGLAVVVGVGLNLRFTGAVPPEVAARAVTLETLAAPGTPTSSPTGPPTGTVAREEVVEAVLVSLETRLRAAEADGAEAILGPYRGRCCTLDRFVRFQTPKAVVEGRAVAVADDGALVIETTEGPVAVTAGDAHHV